MSSEVNLYVSSVLPADCPEKLKKTIDECMNPNEILDNLLKVNSTIFVIKLNFGVGYMVLLIKWS